MSVGVVSNNPYRVLGVYVNSSARDIVANVNKAKAYLKVGKKVEFPADLNNYLPPISRSLESIDSAQSQISQTQDKVRNALFWFCVESSIDEIAIGYLNANNTSKAISIFEKKDSYSSLLNRAVIAINENELAEAVKCYTTLIHEYRYRTDFLSFVCGGKTNVSEAEVSHLLIEVLIDTFSSAIVKNAFANSSNIDDINYIHERAVSLPIKSINSEIAIAKQAGKQAISQLKAGIVLKDNTNDALLQLKELIGTEEQYQIGADNLAKQILQCSINYYNDSTDYDKARKALVLQKYALSISVGHLMTERCRENVSVLEEAISNLPPEELLPIRSSLEKIIIRFSSQKRNIDNVIEFIKECSPFLADIRDVQGRNGKYYRAASTQVEEIALSALIDIVNNAIKDVDNSKSNDYSSILGNSPIQNSFLALLNLKSILREAWEATAYLELLDIDSKAKQRLNEQKASLKGLLEQLKESTYLAPVSFRIESHADKQRLSETISKCTSFNEAVDLLSRCNDEESVSKLDDKCFELCQTKSNYKEYVRSFGLNARHKSEAEEHFKFDLMINNLWKYVIDNKFWFIVFAILLAILIGVGLIWGIRGYSGLLFIIAAISGMGAFGTLNEKGGCGTAIICLIIAAAAFIGATAVEKYADRRERERAELVAFEELKDRPTIDDCKSFLSNYSESTHKDEVLGLYYLCAESSGVENLHKFAEEYSTTDWGAKASERVTQLCDSLYQIAEQKNTIQAWKEYQASVPYGHYADSNDKIESIENEAWSTEAKAWNQATKENTLSAYQKYLNLYPRGSHRVAADKKVIDLQVADVYESDHGELPSMSQTGYGGGSTTSISVQNNTSYTLTLLYSGPDSKRVTILPHQTSFVTLKNGFYRIAASVNASDVRNFAGSQTFNGGSYSSQYYISMSRY